MTVDILITHKDWLLEAFGIEEGCLYFAKKTAEGNYFVSNGWDNDGIEVKKEHCEEVNK